VALAEMAIGGRLGVEVDRPPHSDLPTAFFAESNGRFVCEIAPEDLAWFSETVQDVTVLGMVTADPTFTLPAVEIPLDRLIEAFTGRPA
jgi:phosphoribosylformylglycinamidine (FGAM) synthase-like enzyme